MAKANNTNDQILKKHIVPYEKRLVAFLDLQGFKDDIILNYPPEAIGSLFGKFNSLKGMLERDDNDLQVTIISDSIVISVTLNKSENLIHFFNACSFFAKPRMGNLFIAIRGGIAYGDLHHKDNIVFGPALVDAYDISEGKRKSDFLHVRMPAEVYKLISQLPIFGKFSMAVLFPESEKKEYYIFNPWLFHLTVACMEGTQAAPEAYDDIILRLKEHVAWSIMNIAKYRESSPYICAKYEELLIQTLCTFDTIKNIHYHILSSSSQKIVDFYSDSKKAIPFAHQLEQQLKAENIM